MRAEHLLLHVSGLTADNAVADYQDGREKALERIAAMKLEAPVGTRFSYSSAENLRGGRRRWRLWADG